MEQCCELMDILCIIPNSENNAAYIICSLHSNHRFTNREYVEYARFAQLVWMHKYPSYL